MEIERKLIEKRYSKMSVYNGVAYFFVVPDRPFDASDDIEIQVEQAFRITLERLAEVNSKKEDLLFVTIILNNSAYLEKFNAMWDEWVSDIVPPTRACFFAELTDPNLKVEFIIQAKSNS